MSRAAINPVRPEPVEGPPSVRIWQGIEAEHPPVMRHDTADLLAMAEQLLESRRKRFPAMIDKGELPAEIAADQLVLFEHIVTDVRWLLTGEGAPAPLGTLYRRADAIDESLRTVAGLAGQQGGFDARLQHQALCLIALRHFHEPLIHAATLRLKALTLELRARARANPSPVIPAQAGTQREKENTHG